MIVEKAREKMSSFSVATLQEKLSRLSASQESIETLSLWAIHHKAFAKTSVAVWADSFTKADPDHRLVLLYLANDVLQNGKRKGIDEVFHDLFRDPLLQVVPLISGQKIQSSVERMFRIWRERKVYDKVFVRQLELLLSGQPSTTEAVAEPVAEPVPEPVADKTQPDPAEPLPDFKLSLLEDAMLELSKFQGEMRVKEASVGSLPIDIWDSSSLEVLKDKSEGTQFSSQFDEAWGTLKDYSDCLAIEVSERANLSTMLTSCVAHQAQELARVQQDVKVYKALLVQLSSCREKLSARQKDLERAQQTATSDPSCREDLTEVGDMEIDSEEEAMDTQLPPPPQPPAVLLLPPPVPQMFSSAPQMITSTPQVMSSSPQVINSAPQIINSAPQMINSAPQMINSAPQMINNAPQMINAGPQMINAGAQVIVSTPPMINSTPQMLNSGPQMISAPQMINSTPQQIKSAPPMINSLPSRPTYSQPYLPPAQQGFHPPPILPSRGFSRPLLPSVQTTQHSMMTQQRLQTPPTAMQAPPPAMLPQYPFAPRGGYGTAPRPVMVQVRPQPPRGPVRPNMIQPPVMSGPPVGGGVSTGREEVHIEATPVLYCSDQELKPSLDDRLKSLAVKKSFSNVLLPEYREGVLEGGEKPYSPSTEPLPLNSSVDEADDESVTTPTPQLESPSPITPEEPGPPRFNPANPIMKALYHSPTHSPEEVEPEASAGALSSSDKPAVPPAPQSAGAVDGAENDSILSGVDTGMLQTILKNVQFMIPPLSPPKQPLPSRPSPPVSSASPPALVEPPKQTLASVPPRDVPSSDPASAAAAKSSQSPSNIKITTSLTSLLDEIFPQLSKSLQERKRKQEPEVEGRQGGEGVPGRPKQAKVDGAPMQPRMMGPNPVMRLPRPPGGPNGPRPDGGFPPRGMMRPLRPSGPRHPGFRPPGMGMRPLGLRPPLEGGLRPKGPLFEGNFRPRGPPRPDGNFRPPGPPRPRMQLVGERLQRPPGPPGQRPAFGPRNPNSAPPPRQPFTPHSSYQPRMPPVSAQNLMRPLYSQGGMRPPPMRAPSRPPPNSSMDPNHFPEGRKSPQSHDSLYSIPPPGMGAWPGRP